MEDEVVRSLSKYEVQWVEDLNRFAKEQKKKSRSFPDFCRRIEKKYTITDLDRFKETYWKKQVE